MRFSMRRNSRPELRGATPGKKTGCCDMPESIFDAISLFRRRRGEQLRRQNRIELKRRRNPTFEGERNEPRNPNENKQAEHGFHFCLTSKMSHDHGRRAACRMTIWILWFHFDPSYDSTRRDGHGRWLWRLVRRLVHFTRRAPNLVIIPIIPRITAAHATTEMTVATSIASGPRPLSPTFVSATHGMLLGSITRWKNGCIRDSGSAHATPTITQLIKTEVATRVVAVISRRCFFA